jgi:hypothetical protein
MELGIFKKRYLIPLGWDFFNFSPPERRSAMHNLLSLSRRFLWLVVGILIINPGCGGSPPADEPGTAVDGGGSNTLALANAKIAAMQAAVDTCQAQNKRLGNDLATCQAAANGTADTFKLAAAAQDTRIWVCARKGGASPLQGQWKREAVLDTKNNIFVIQLLVDGSPTVACPSIGDLRSLSAEDRFFCRQEGDKPFYCNPLP